MPDTSLLERIKKLLRMASSGSGATENEAAVALQKANELLLRHNLTLADINLKDSEAADARLAHEDMEVLNEDWRVDLIRAIASANLCHVIRVKLPHSQQHMTWVPTKVHLIGTETNRLVVKELYLWISEQIEGKYGLYLQAYREEFGVYGRPRQSDKKPREFRYGFFMGITRRLVERIEGQKVRAGNLQGCTALVLAHDEKNKQYARDHWNLVKGEGQRIQADAGAYRVGVKSGDRVSFGGERLPGGSRALGPGR